MNQLVQNDFGITLSFTVNKESGSPRDLTNDTVTLKINRPNSTVTQTCTITDPINGVCQYTLQDGDLSEKGTYFLEVQASGTGYRYTSVQYMNLIIRPE